MSEAFFGTCHFQAQRNETVAGKLFSYRNTLKLDACCFPCTSGEVVLRGDVSHVSLCRIAPHILPQAEEMESHYCMNGIEKATL